MKVSLTSRLISIMVLSIFISSLVSILLVSTVTMNRIRLMNSRRDRNIAAVVADSLTAAAKKGQLDLTLGTMSMRHNGQGMMEGHRGMMDQRDRFPVLPFRPLIVPEGNEPVPLIITDAEGRILQGEFRAPEDGRYRRRLSVDEYSQGEPFLSDGEVAGYVLAGNQAGQTEGLADLYHMSSLFHSILLYPILSALCATVLGVLLLRRTLRPLGSLHRGVLTLQKGDYGFRVDIPSSRLGLEDDLTLLSRGFNDMAESLEASEEWKKQIISDTAHELRTPVSLIMGNLEMILDGVYKADRPRLESLYRETCSLADLVRNLQTLASEESGSRKNDISRFSLSDLVKGTAEDFRALGLQRNITLQSEVQEDVHFVGDRQKTKQVLGNLMTNALRHTPSEGRILLRCGRKENYIYVDIEDSGPGVPEELREKIFNRFFKIDKSRNSEGSGLGLSISRIIIENQGGTLKVFQGESGGALFRISFPCKEII